MPKLVAMKEFQIERIMLYFEIKKLLREKFSVSQISRELNISRKTVYFYKDMSEEQFLKWVGNIHQKPHKLLAYEAPIHKRLKQHPSLSSYQVHDWLLEHYPDVQASRRSVSNFVAYLRKAYGLPKPSEPLKPRRDYSPILELPYGEQAQADFGVYKMEASGSQEIKVYFMVMVLSRSRYKHVYFRSTPFTTQAVIEAHEAAFAYLCGIPRQMVYDQDKLMVVSENRGDILLTAMFEAYVKQRKFGLYICRGADPETKGKAENVVKYVKTNFLRNRLYVNDEVLNSQGVAWLDRTANGQVHGATQKVPAQEWQIERRHLLPFTPLNLESFPYQVYHLRKDNSIAYKGNFYTVPKGIYQGKGTQVWVEVKEQKITIYDGQKKVLACYGLCLDKGKIITNTDHARDKSGKIKALMEETAQQFTDTEKALEYFTALQKSKGRYIRDQLQLIRKTLKAHSEEAAGQALAFCHANHIYSANDFAAVAQKLAGKQPQDTSTNQGWLLKDIDRSIYNTEPRKSNIDDYESIVKPQ